MMLRLFERLIKITKNQKLDAAQQMKPFGGQKGRYTHQIRNP